MTILTPRIWSARPTLKVQKLTVVETL